jgi:nucleotide-binding universal stress UspA family protein
MKEAENATSISNVLCLGDPRCTVAQAYARSLASAFRAHLTFASLVLELGAPNTTEMVSYDIFVSALESSKATKLAELEDVARLARSEDISGEPKVITAPLGTAWQAIADFARAFDLAIIEQSGGTLETDSDLEIEAAVFGSGRPILVVPYIHRAPFKIERLIVAWDGSAGAARAMGDAMPLLARGAEIHILSVAKAPDRKLDESGAAIVRHLSHHGLPAEFKLLISSIDPANTLLSYASDISADLLIMGAYGHSRYREFLLGGVTRSILEAMTLPVFMSH